MPWVQIDLARCHALLQAVRLMTWKLVRAVSDNTLGPAQASSVKVFGTERVVDVYRILQGVLGPVAQPAHRVARRGAARRARASRRGPRRSTRSAVGSNEIQRDLVATAGLGLTRSR